MAKNFQIFQEFPRGLAGISFINLQYFGHNFRTRNARNYTKPSEDLYYAYFPIKTRVIKMVLAIGVQDLMTSS